jgi:hypothetical protein
MTPVRAAFGAAIAAFALLCLNQVVPVLTPKPESCPPPKKVVIKALPVGNPCEMEVIRLTNIERNRHGLASLKPVPEIMRFARNWSAVQAGSRMHHSRGSGYAENVAVGQKTPEDVMRAWMTSRGHRQNILNPNYRYIGVGYINNGRPYWTQNFK